MGTIIRFIVSAPVAAVVTVLIFLFIYNQLSPRPFLYTTPEEPDKVYVQIADFEEELVIRCFCGWLPERPSTSNPWSDSEKAVKEAPRQPSQKPSTKIEVTSLLVEDIKPCDGRDQQALSLHRIAPPFPESCLRKGADGPVIVRYDITPEGRTANISIIESPDDCFNQAVISIVRKYRFRPLCRGDGTPVGRTGVTETITFEIAD